MSDVNVQPAGEPYVQPATNEESSETDVQDQDQEQPQASSGAFKVKVVGLPVYDSFTFGEEDEKVTIGRDGTDVSSDQLPGILTAARNAGFQLEVVPES